MKKIAVVTYLIAWLCPTALLLWYRLPLSALLSSSGLLFTHLLFGLLLVGCWVTRYLVLAVKAKELGMALRQLGLFGVLPLAIVGLTVRMVVADNQQEDFAYAWNHEVENKRGTVTDRFAGDGKIRGVSTYGLGRREGFRLTGIMRANVEWLAVHPYISQEGEHSVAMSVPEKVGSWSPKDSVFLREIARAKTMNFRIMLKPHLWLNSGWRGNISFGTQGEWNQWFANYRANLLHLARLAESAEVEILCVGTELPGSIVNLEAEWIDLIGRIRELFTGKLVYAANWDSKALLDHPDFWTELDYIGIQAYYPLTHNTSPSLADITTGWQAHTAVLRRLHRQHGKPILFTELGYRADTEATVTPWAWNHLLSPLTRKKSYRTQLLAFEGFFQANWHENWCAGVFVWQWNNSIDFSIEGKPAENCVAKWYQKSTKDLNL